MMMNRKLQKAICVGLMATCLYGGSAYAAEQPDIDTQIQEQEQRLQELNKQKASQKNQEMIKRLSSLEDKLSEIKKMPSYDAEGAVNALATQINELRQQLSATTEAQTKIMELLDKMSKKTDAPAKTTGRGVTTAIDEPVDLEIMPLSPAEDYAQGYHGTAASSKYLVNPGQGQNVSYTQDAINAQGNSTMVFSYSPNQLYKIYCRRGFLTDLVFKKGETINYVGGGDTSGWAVSNTTVDGVPHLFIKPVVESSTTNLVVATDKRSYQLILNTSDWYNPIVSWVYEAEERNANLLEKAKNERITTGKINVRNIEDLDYNYDVSGNGTKPTMIFSDGERTYIKFKNAPRKQLPLFIRQRGHKSMQLVNYTIKDNYYIVEKVFDVAQIKDGQDTLTIKHK